MNRQIPVANRVIHKKQLQRSNDFHLNKITSMKFSNFSSLKSKNEAQSAHKVRPIDLTKLLPTEGRHKRVRTVMNDERIREENKNLYNRLVNQKPTLSSKLFAEERHKNIEFLKRIGRYPYRPSSTLLLDPLHQEVQQGRLERSNTGTYSLDPSEESNTKISLQSLESMKHYQINCKIEEEERKQYTILLWSKVVQLQKTWYTVKFTRLKSHYQIEVSPYPSHQIFYSIRLEEEVGTAMLSENDYDYEFIVNKFIKFTHETLCLSFELKEQKKKHFYKFNKKTAKTTASLSSSPNHHEGPPQSPPVRKTVFAIENEQYQLKKQSVRPRFMTQEIEESNLQSALDNMSKEDIVIDLSRHGL